MVTQEHLAGNWNELMGKVKERWGAFSDDEFAQCEGDVDQLVGMIQQKTGEARERIETALAHWSEQTGAFASDAASSAQALAAKALDAAKEHLGQAGSMIKRRPAESIVVSFGTGVLIGVVVGLVASRRS